jgi:hypothetical protein
MTDLDKYSTDTIKYTGSVTMTTKRGDKVLGVKKYHNQGLPKLFKGLGNLLAYTGAANSNLSAIANAIIPNAIALYSFSSEERANQYPPTKSWADLIAPESATNPTRRSGLERITPLIPVSAVTLSEDGGVKLQFKIESSQITTGKRVYLLALYPRKLDTALGKETEDSAIAIYRLTTAGTTGFTGVEDWKAATVITSSTLLVEWHMSFSDK